MATIAISTASETNEWVQACTEHEQCEIEALSHNVSFIESALMPPVDPKETNSMYFLKNIPRTFCGNGSNKLWVFIDKKAVLRKRPMVVQRSILGYGDLTQDAWGHQKVVMDISLFSSSFTFNIDRKLWVPYEDGIEIYDDINLTKMQSLNGKLSVSSGAVLNGKSYLMSRRHPRYQPNRGQLYSTSIFLPTKNAIGKRSFGLFNSDNGAFFSLEDGVLYAVIRTTISGVTSEPFKEAIDFNDIGFPQLDIENGNIYDIQMQWRGVGNIKFFIGDPSRGVSKLVAIYKHLNTETELSISNPSLPAAYECTNTDGTEVKIECGCVDVSTESGSKGNRTYASTTTGEIVTTTDDTPMIALRIPNSYNGDMNTRDIVFAAVTPYCDVAALIKIYYFRDPTAITATFAPIRDGFQQRAIGLAITAFDITKMEKLFETRIPALDSRALINPDKAAADLYLTHGDYIFITMKGKNNSLGGVTIEYAEEI